VAAGDGARVVAGIDDDSNTSWIRRSPRGLGSTTSCPPPERLPDSGLDVPADSSVLTASRWMRWLDGGMTARYVAARLPDIETLRRRCLAVATLDAILSPVWENRYYSYTANWGGNVSAAEIRDGSGNDCFIVFTTHGVFIKGYDHKSPMAPRYGDTPKLWPGLVEGLPAVFTQFLTEPAFAGPDGFIAMTFCIWREYHDSQWHTGPVDFTGFDRYDTDGAKEMLGVLCDPTPLAYGSFAFGYFEVDIDPAALQHVFALGPVTDQIVRTINPVATLDDLVSDLASSGYPTGQSREDNPAAFDSTPRIPEGTRNVGTWGTGPFDNDAARDWANAFDATAVGGRAGFLANTYGKSDHGDPLDNDAASRSLPQPRRRLHRCRGAHPSMANLARPPSLVTPVSPSPRT